MKLTTQPFVTCGVKRNPCAVVAGTRITAGAEIGRLQFKTHFAPALFDQQHLEEVAVAVARIVQSWTDERDAIVSI